MRAFVRRKTGTISWMYCLFLIAVAGFMVIVSVASSAEAKKLSGVKSSQTKLSQKKEISAPKTKQSAGDHSIGKRQSERLSSLENALFAVLYQEDSVPQRLNRLESTIFGQAQSGSLSVDSRIEALESALSPQALGALSPMTGDSPQVSEEDPSSSQVPGQNHAQNVPANQSYPSVASQHDSGSLRSRSSEASYPTVSRIEDKQFGKTFERDDITLRLDKLEKAVFNHTQNGSLSERVDHLRLTVLGDTGNLETADNQVYTYNGNQYSVQNPLVISKKGKRPLYQPQGQQQQSYSVGRVMGAGGQGYYNTSRTGNLFQGPISNPMGRYTSNNSVIQSSAPITYQPQVTEDMINPNASKADMMTAIDSIENDVLGSSFPTEPLNTRLDRLEQKVFNSTSPELSPEDRMDRIIAVASAGGSGESSGLKPKGGFQSWLPIILTILPMLLL